MHKCTSYGPDMLNSWPFWPLFDPCDPDLQPTLKLFQMTLLLLEDNNCAKLFWNPCINVQIMLRTSSIHVFEHFDLYLTPVTLTFNLFKKMFQMALLLLKGNNYAKLFWNPCIIVQVMVRTNPDGHTHIHQTKIVMTMSPLPASGLDNNRDIRKCQSFCTMPPTTPGLWQYLDVFFENSQAKK